MKPAGTKNALASWVLFTHKTTLAMILAQVTLI